MPEMSLREYAKACAPYYLNPGFLYVAEQPTALRTVLGSCVSVCLHDKRLRYGGMNHFLLPESPERERTGRYGRPAIQALLRAFIDFGSHKPDLVAHLVGGAGMAVDSQSQKIGQMNAQIARDLLNRYGIPIVSEDVGGVIGRKVLFLTERNQLVVFKLDKIREADFYDYQDRSRTNDGSPD
jgi:chemotaxis protein CheD